MSCLSHITLPLCNSFYSSSHSYQLIFLVFLLKLGIKGIALSDVWTNFNLVGSLIIYIIISTVYVKTWGLKFPPSVSKVSHSKLHFSLLRMVVVQNHDFTMWIVTQSLSNRCFLWVFWFKPRLWSTFSHLL